MGCGFWVVGYDCDDYDVATEANMDKEDNGDADDVEPPLLRGGRGSVGHESMFIGMRDATAIHMDRQDTQDS